MAADLPDLTSLEAFRRWYDSQHVHSFEEDEFVERLYAAFRVLAEDRERLDWLVANCKRRADAVLWMDFGAPASTPTEHDLRAAIDAARAKETT